MPRILIGLAVAWAVAVTASPAAGADFGENRKGSPSIDPVTATISDDVAAVAVSRVSGNGAPVTSGGGTGGSARSCVYEDITALVNGQIDRVDSDVFTIVGEPSANATFVRKTCRDLASGTETVQALAINPQALETAIVANLVEQARATLQPPTPAVGINPSWGTVIRVPLWLWTTNWANVESPPASAAGITAWVTATPTRVVWNTGDHHTETCTNPGVVYDTTRDDDDQHTGCSHTYTDTTGNLTVTATQHWHVTYRATNGQTGDLGTITTTTTIPIRVRELVTNIRLPKPAN